MLVVYLFKNYPLFSVKQDEFNIWAKIVSDKEKFDFSNSKLSLDKYMGHFTKLVYSLDLKKKNNI